MGNTKGLSHLPELRVGPSKSNFHKCQHNFKPEGKQDDKKDHIVFSVYKFEDLTVEEYYDKSIVMTNACYDKSM